MISNFFIWSIGISFSLVALVLIGLGLAGLSIRLVDWWNWLIVSTFSSRGVNNE